MTEEEWLVCESSQRMLRFLHGKSPQRRLRLFLCACCRVVEHLLGPEARELLDIAERFADSLATPQELSRARDRARHADKQARARCSSEQTSACRAVRLASNENAEQGWQAWWECELALHAEAHGSRFFSPPCRFDGLVWVVHDVFGNPFRLPSIATSCFTPDVLSLAQAAYEERLLPSGELDPVRLAVLADALEEAGATGEILTHLRLPGSHVRGCWVIEGLMRRP